MREWLASEAIAKLTAAGNFPTPETAVLWQRFSDDMLNLAQQKWNVGRATRAFYVGVDDEKPPEGIYRIEFEFDAARGDAWLTTPDYRRVAKFKNRTQGSRSNIFSARVKKDSSEAEIERFGPGVVKWPK